MKANEAPERVYLDSRKAWQKTFYDYFTIKAKANDIEYIRKDAFIEKACEFLKSYRQEIYNGQGYIAGIVNDETIEDFKNYMQNESR